VQLGRDLLNNHAGSAGALIVHRGNLLAPPVKVSLLKEDHLGVLPAKFDHRAHLRVGVFHCQSYRGHFLHKAGAQQLRQLLPAAARHKKAQVAVGNAELALGLLQRAQHGFRLPAFMAAVIEQKVFSGLRGAHHRLDGRRTYVNSNQKTARGRSRRCREEDTLLPGACELAARLLNTYSMLPCTPWKPCSASLKSQRMTRVSL
jgi:hypothetical protein